METTDALESRDLIGKDSFHQEALRKELQCGNRWEEHKKKCSMCRAASHEEELCDAGRSLQKSWGVWARAVQGVVGYGNY